MFEYISDEHSRRMLTNGYNAAIKLEMQDFFKNESPPDGYGYMFWNNDQLRKLSQFLESDGHSGSSFAWVCRNLQAYFQDPVKFSSLWTKT